jgi:WhiB family redox-sensing transcriptional regulator
MTATVTPINWRMSAACATADPELFFGPDGERDDYRDARETEAKKVCAGCAVAGLCLRDALDGEIRWGVFGGTSEAERAKLIRRNRRDQQEIAS